MAKTRSVRSRGQKALNFALVKAREFNQAGRAGELGHHLIHFVNCTCLKIASPKLIHVWTSNARTQGLQNFKKGLSREITNQLHTYVGGDA